jgi:eukaryotic-like serine/threonine-protein kinase
MANIRGISLISAVKYVTEQYGEGGMNKVLDNLGQEEKDVFRSKLNPMNWYPISAYANFIGGVDKIFGKGDFALCFEIGRYSAMDTFSGLYKVFMELGNPHFVIRRGHIAWRTIVDTGELEVEQTGDKYVKVKVTGFDGPQKSYCFKVGGYFSKVLEMSGAKNVKVQEIQCACDRATFCEYEMQWE